MLQSVWFAAIGFSVALMSLVGLRDTKVEIVYDSKIATGSIRGEMRSRSPRWVTMA